MQLALFLALLCGTAAAQTPHARWNTVETENFRIHYPVTAEDWALQSAGQMEAIRERVIAEVGWTATQRMDIVIRDPLSSANGMAIPFMTAPRMEFWSTPPGPESVIGHYRGWGELLLTHEYAHQAHLLRSARSPSGKLVQGLTGIGPVARKCPRWVTEGYATIVEARLSGYGRPNASYRAAFLRRLAQEGQLPAFGALNDFSRFQGGAFAYLVGSAYLEWLDERAGGDSLVKLWRRLSAVEERDFEEAFSGLYGESPSRLYARFVAELTHQALAVEAQRPVDSGTLWQTLSWYTGEPAISPNGEKIAVVVRSESGPSTLQIWSTGPPDEEKETEREEALTEQLERDPEDVLDLPPKHAEHEELQERVNATRAAQRPRWLPDGEALLFTAHQYDAGGRLRPDLYTWEPETGREKRITVHGDVRTADPSPDGTFAVAIRQNWGKTELVRVDLGSGAIENVAESSVDVVYDQPRIAADGNRVAYLVHRGEGWGVEILDFTTSAVTHIGGGIGTGIPTHIAWGPGGGSLYASVGAGGFAEIWELLADDGRGRQITRSDGPTSAPEPTPDGEAVFYLEMNHTGLELHRIALADVVPDVAKVDALPPIVLPPLPPATEPPEMREHEAPRGYGVGRSEVRALIGGAWSPSQGQVEGGVRAGDIIGRREALLLGAFGGNEGVSGGLLGLEYRGLPVDLGVQGFTAFEEPELMRRYGGALGLDVERLGSRATLGAHLGAWVDMAYADKISDEDTELLPQDVVVTTVGDRQVAHATLDWAWIEGRRRWWGVSLRGRGQFGVTGAEAWQRAEGTATAWFGNTAQLRGTYTYGASNAVSGLDRYRLGGVPSAVMPRSVQWSRVQSPAFAVGSLRGANRDEVRAALEGLGPTGIFAERHRMDDGPLGASGAMIVGVGASMSVAEQPIGKLPSVDVDGGLSCQIEDPVTGFDDRPCLAFDDYALWLSATWRL